MLGDGSASVAPADGGSGGPPTPKRKHSSLKHIRDRAGECGVDVTASARSLDDMDPVEWVAHQLKIPLDIDEVKVRRHTLSFVRKDRSRVPQLEKSFAEETARRFQTVLRYSTFAFLIAQVLFIPYDYVNFYQREDKSQFWWVIALRFGLYTPTAAAIMALTYKRDLYVRRAQWLALAACVLGGGIITFTFLGDQPGYGTLALFIVYTSSFTPLLAQTAVAVEAVLLAVFIPLRFVLFPEDAAKDKLEDVGVIVLFFFTINYISHKREYFLRRNHVQERTLVLQQLKLEREEGRSTKLLQSMLPEEIIDGLKSGTAKLADDYTAVTVLFCEICGFSSISAQVPPATAVRILSRIYAVFDALVEYHNVHKVETVGEVYMCVVGAPLRCQNHADLAANMALAMQAAMPSIREALEPEMEGLNVHLAIHIGLNSGPVVAGVVGTRNPRWKLFGDTVNTASRMESTCPEGRIQCSAVTSELLYGGYVLEERGEIPVKGKGNTVTHFLVSGRGTAVPFGEPRTSGEVPPVPDLTRSTHSTSGSSAARSATRTDGGDSRSGAGGEEEGTLTPGRRGKLSPLDRRSKRPMTRGESRASKAIARWRQAAAGESGDAVDTAAGPTSRGKHQYSVIGTVIEAQMRQMVTGDSAVAASRRRRHSVHAHSPGPTFEAKGRLHNRLQDVMRSASSRFINASSLPSPTRPRGMPLSATAPHRRMAEDTFGHGSSGSSDGSGRQRVSPGTLQKVEEEEERADVVATSAAAAAGAGSGTRALGSSPTRLSRYSKRPSAGSVASSSQVQGDVETGTAYPTGSTATKGRSDPSHKASRLQRLSQQASCDGLSADVVAGAFEDAMERPDVLESRWALLFPPVPPSAFEQEFRDANTKRMLRLNRVSVGLCLVFLVGFTIWDRIQFNASGERQLHLVITRWAFIGPAALLYLGALSTRWAAKHLEPVTAVAILLVGAGIVATSVLGGDPGYGVLSLFIVYCYNLTSVSLGYRMVIFAALILGHLVFAMVFVDSMTLALMWNQAAFLLVFFLGQAIPVLWREVSIREDFFRRSVLQSQWEVLKDEEERTEALLRNLLPASVADQLKDGATMVADHFDKVSVLFTDMKHFTSFSSKVTPADVVDFLNAMYSDFDRISAHYGLYKVEIIGDAYYVVSGCPDRVDDHAKRLVHAAFDMLEMMPQLREMTQSHIQIRIGIHTGPVVAGVVGRLDPRYHLFGSTVVEANKMESHGVVDTVHVSATTREDLADDPDFVVEDRGEIEVSGVGTRHTYFVVRRLKNSLGAYHRKAELVGVPSPSTVASPSEVKAQGRRAKSRHKGNVSPPSAP